MSYCMFFFFFFNDTAPTEIYPLSLHDALPILLTGLAPIAIATPAAAQERVIVRERTVVRHDDRRFHNRTRYRSVCHTERRSEEHTSELQSRQYLVCRLLLEKKKNNIDQITS